MPGFWVGAWWEAATDEGVRALEIFLELAGSDT